MLWGGSDKPNRVGESCCQRASQPDLAWLQFQFQNPARPPIPKLRHAPCAGTALGTATARRLELDLHISFWHQGFRCRGSLPASGHLLTCPAILRGPSVMAKATSPKGGLDPHEYVSLHTFSWHASVQYSYGIVLVVVASLASALLAYAAP